MTGNFRLPGFSVGSRLLGANLTFPLTESCSEKFKEPTRRETPRREDFSETRANARGDDKRLITLGLLRRHEFVYRCWVITLTEQTGQIRRSAKLS